jgi:hypothetical protein
VYILKVIFIALLHGMDGQAVPVAEAVPTTKFPTEEACKAAGETIYGSFAPQVDARLKADGIGVLQGAKIVCKMDGEQI